MVSQSVTALVVVIFGAIIVRMTTAAENPLDAPLVPKPPTTRSELVRGGDAAFGCTLSSESSLDDIEKCVDSAQITNRQKMGQGFEAFDTGLYFQAWSMLNSRVSAAHGTTLLGNLNTLKRLEKFYWEEYRDSRKVIALSDAQVVDGLKIGGPINQIISEAIARYGD